MNAIGRLGTNAIPPPGLGAGVGGPSIAQGIGAPGVAGGGEFKNLLLDSLAQVNSMQMNANQAVQSLMTGGEVNPAEVLSAVQKADMSFRLMLQIRNKLVQAWQEIKDVRV